ncbi:MAG: efflux RND transporter permease subunit [Phycisphaerae bacterium]|nr:efflux RND transporter permease subunit [Phycisphaerae bacterium]
MNMSELFIRRPVLTTLTMISILIFGVIAFLNLPVSDLPNVDFPTISVSASLPGASPETMANAVAMPLEKEFTTIAGIDAMSSTSSQGSTSITITFNLERNIDMAAQDVNAAIGRVMRRLPPDMPNPPSYRKVNPSDAPILYLALTGDNMPMSTLDEYGQTLLAQAISQVTGVSQVQVFGTQKYAVRIEVDPFLLATKGIGIDEIAAAIDRQNVSAPLGQLQGPDKAVSIEDNGQLFNAAQYRPLIVAYRDGRPVRLQDVGDAYDRVENERSGAWLYWRDDDGNPIEQRAIVLAIQRQPGANTIQVAEGVKKLLPDLERRLPAGVKLTTLRDSSLPIKESAEDVEFHLVLTIGLVVMIIFIFLRNFSATFIPSLALPMSIIGTFIVMHALGYSLNNLSLMALTLSVGFVVDDAIVMLENIVRHMEMGKPRFQAALDGSREVGFTIVSMTLSLSAVFIPVLFMGGLMGRLFHEFAVTIGVAVLVSGVVSLTLTPMLSSRMLRDTHKTRHNWLYRISEAGFVATQRGYGWLLGKVLRQRVLVGVFSLAIAAATMHFFQIIPKGFIPSEDRGMFTISTEAAQDVSYDAMVRYQAHLAEILRQQPEVDRFMSSAGGGGPRGGSNTGSMLVILTPREGRASVDEIIARLRPHLNATPGIRAMISNPPPINVGGRMSRSLYQLTLQSTDIEQLQEFAQELEATMREMPSLQDISSDLQIKTPQLRVDTDREKASAKNISPLQVQQAIYSAFGDRQVTRIQSPNNDYAVILTVAPQWRTHPDVLNMLYVRSGTGHLVPLSEVTERSERAGVLTVNHTGQLPSVTISFNLREGVSIGQATDELRALHYPDGITPKFQGTAAAFEDSVKSMGPLLILAILVIYIILGILYEDFLHPLTILSALPFAGFGALVTLHFFGAELSIYAFVGIVMLIGLVKKNGIMMVDFALELQRTKGMAPREAIHEASIIRFRPIMMTTFAALMGAIPIAIGHGAGGESRQPLGLAVVGGLLFSQLLTMFVTPVFFLYMEGFRKLFQRKKATPIANVMPVLEEQGV